LYHRSKSQSIQQIMLMV